MLNTIELFAGVGGFRVGLERATGFNVVWGNQWEPSKKRQDAFDCYARNFSGKGIHSNEDIATVDTELFQEKHIQLLVGGFPCQDYSVAQSTSNRKGIEGKKGVLFWQIIRLLHDIQPTYVLLENVDRLLKSPTKQKGRDFSIMLASFRDLGYSVEWRVLNAADYGQAQRRRRTFIFACRNEHPHIQSLQSLESPDILHQKGFFAPVFPVQNQSSEKHLPQSITLPTDILEISNTFSVDYRNAGIMKNGIVYTEELIPQAEQPIPLGSLLERDVEEKYYLDEEKFEKYKYLKSSKSLERTSATGFTYIYSEGAIPFPEPLDKPSRTMLTSEASVNRSTHVIQDPQTGRYRVLTPVECERLNGFPDNWTEGMSERMRYFCMGNALVVGLIERMARRITELEQQVSGDKPHSEK